MSNKWIVILALWLVACKPGTQLTQSVPQGAIGQQAMVVSAHPLATQVGVYILEQGGNAVDAAIAVQFALAVVYPRAGNIGGGGFALIRWHDGETAALDFREKAPALSRRDMYLDAEGNVIPDRSTLGHLAAGVPGTVAGMWELHQRYGSLPWAELVQPAINIAFEGHRITADEAAALNEKQNDFIKANQYTPWVIKPDGWKDGDPINQPQLAATLLFVRDKGRDGFYTGIVADQLQKEMTRGGGIISMDDLAAYEAKWRTPLLGTYKNHRVISMPPPSSGGVALLQLLQGAAQLNLAQYAHNSVEAVHVMAELERRVFADRAAYLGDPDFVDVPVAQLLDSAYNRARFGQISLRQATSSSEIKAGLALSESDETTHFSIADGSGNAVALTTTLNGNYGSKVMVKGAGFFLNNEMDDFSAKPGVPNMFGLVGAEANAIAPGKRMLSSMTPVIIEQNGQLKMVVGTPGGATIITSVFQTIVNVLDYQMTMQQAVEAKKIHHQWLPDEILVEEGALSEKQIRQLEKMGHAIKLRDKIGRTDCILVLPDGTLEGGADPRGDDYAEGF